MTKLPLIVLCLLATFSSANAQNYLYATGQPAYSTSLPIDSGFVNVNNGEIHLEIPLALYQQRGSLALDEKLVYDSRIWRIVQNGSTYSWQPNNVASSNGGWRFSSGGGDGAVTYSNYGGTDSHAPDCPGPADAETYDQRFQWYWTDPRGTVHPFPSVSTVQYNPGDVHCTGTAPEGNATSTGTASDGSGYQMAVSNYQKAVITGPDGTTYYPASGGTNPTPAGNVTDRNGNYFTSDASGNLVGTSGIAPILVTASGNQTTYSVLTVGGVREPYTVTTTTVYFNTDFAESPVQEASGSFTAIQSIMLPDKSTYQFYYDSGTTAGHYGELTGMTLPTGGMINYDWSGFLDSFNNSNRWLTGMVRDGGTTTFTPAVISKCTSSAGCQESVTVQTPDKNDTVYTFNLDKAALAAGSSWVQGIQSYQGTPSSGTLLRSTSSAYTYTTYSYSADENASFYVVGNYQVPASVTTTVTLNDVGLKSQTTTTLDQTGSLPTDTRLWDYGVSTSGTPTQETITSYGPWGQPNSVIVKDAAGSQISKVTSGYDETKPANAPSGLSNHLSSIVGSGNRTSTHQWINTSGTTLDSSSTYDNAGAMLSLTQPEGTTKYGYDATDTFVTATTLPTPSSGVALSMGATFDNPTGLVTSATDLNNQTTYFSTYDIFSRVVNVNYPGSGRTTFAYVSPNTDYRTTYLTANTGQVAAPTQASLVADPGVSGPITPVYSTSVTYHDTDAYGRVDRVSTSNGQTSNPWYQQDSCFDTSGRLQFQTYTYQGTGLSGAKVCSGTGDTIAYDALGRTASVMHGDGSTVHYSYRGRATEVTDENGVSRVTQVDGLGRIASVCEVSAKSQQGGVAPVSCGQDIAVTGFLTTYLYSNDASYNQMTEIVQGAQTRFFATDSLGRTVLVTEPESGTTTYSYAYSTTNPVGLTVTRKKPTANQASPSNFTTTTTQYDALDRVVTVTYSDGTPNKVFSYDASAGWTEAQTNLKGRLSSHSRVTGAGKAASIYSYDVTGRVAEEVSCLPSGCGNAAYDRPVAYGYNTAGMLTSEGDGAGGTYSYSRSSAGEIIGMTDSVSDGQDPANIIVPNSVTNGPFGPTAYNLGNGLTIVNTYEALGRISGGYVCSGSSALSCAGGTQLYGYIVQRLGTQVKNTCDTILNVCNSFGYDEFNRLTARTVTQGTVQNFTYSYDRFGNRWGQSAPQGGPALSISFNQANNLINTPGYANDVVGNITNDAAHTYTYDADGNLTSVDGGQTARYYYDSLNQRVQIAPTRGTYEFVWDIFGRRVSTWAASTHGFVESNAYSDSGPVAIRTSGGTQFEHQNWLGTERLRTNYNGAVLLSLSSLPWADSHTPSSDNGDQHDFAGMDRDLEDNTEHAQFRQYSTNLGRWQSPDPYVGSYDYTNPQSLNRYAYVQNNPTTLVDPGGLDSAPGSGGCVGAEQSGGVNLIADVECGVDVGIGIYDLLSGLFDGPKFHGSLKPRPTVQPWVSVQHPLRPEYRWRVWFAG